MFVRYRHKIDDIVTISTISYLHRVFDITQQPCKIYNKITKKDNSKVTCAPLRKGHLHV